LVDRLADGEGRAAHYRVLQDYEKALGLNRPAGRGFLGPAQEPERLPVPAFDPERRRRLESV
jgi:hypothetical protein